MLEITFVPCTTTKPDRWRVVGHGARTLVSCDPSLHGRESAQRAADEWAERFGRDRHIIIGEAPSGGYIAVTAPALACWIVRARELAALPDPRLGAGEDELDKSAGDALMGIARLAEQIGGES